MTAQDRELARLRTLCEQAKPALEGYAELQSQLSVIYDAIVHLNAQNDGILCRLDDLIDLATGRRPPVPAQN